jgi:hypothetical protein
MKTSRYKSCHPEKLPHATTRHKTHRLKETRLKEMLDKNQLILLTKSQQTQKCQRPTAHLETGETLKGGSYMLLF